MTYTIYLRTNKVNNKQYVGQTSDFKQRNNAWNCLKYHYANEHINEDREKYGLDAWAVEVLAETDNREDAWELEQRFIKDYNTLWPNGYNLSTGGAGSKGCKCFWKGKRLSEKAKHKMSEAHKGTHHTEDVKKKMSETHKGKHHSEESKKKMSESKKIPVYQYTLDGQLVKIWKSATDAEKELNIFASNIRSCCRGKIKSAGGFKWSFIKL